MCIFVCALCTPHLFSPFNFICVCIYLNISSKTPLTWQHYLTNNKLVQRKWNWVLTLVSFICMSDCHFNSISTLYECMNVCACCAQHTIPFVWTQKAQHDYDVIYSNPFHCSPCWKQIAFDKCNKLAAINYNCMQYCESFSHCLFLVSLDKLFVFYMFKNSAWDYFIWNDFFLVKYVEFFFFNTTISNAFIWR